ncbi:MAG TPA: DUF4388 domain-containing protein [Gemmatimonadaceae bacterium]|nr:DUF4388 domain-containing protein [Gemmatimonadaceae bacterium]
MAIEGPLRELGIHDVFQLLDLSRKTGVLTITSALRDNRGTVVFDRGAVIDAMICSNPHRLGELLVRSGKISEGDLASARQLQDAEGHTRKLGEILVAHGAVSQRELERQVRFQVEEVVFELMSWHEGYFSFEERDAADAAARAAASVRVSTESLLMEGARRIDEWSRIASAVPHLGVVPELATVNDEHAALLDLLPNEWEVLTEIDGSRDLRAIAAELGRSEFEVAKIVYGLATTAVVAVREMEPAADIRDASLDADAAAPYVGQARAALRAGAWKEALDAAHQGASVDPRSVSARLLMARALSRLGEHDDACGTLEQVLCEDALNAQAHREMGYCAARRGAYTAAAISWERYVRLSPDAGDGARIRTAAEAARTLETMLEEDADV